MDPSPLVLPAVPAPPRRSSLPLLAAVAPVGVGIALWLTTGTPQALWFAALGPFMMLASVADAARGRRRDRRRDEATAATQWAAAEEELVRRHRTERAQLDRRHPDVLGCLCEPPLRGAEPPDASTAVVVGRGNRRSAVRCSGGEGERATAFRERSAELADAPLTVPLGRGICVRGAGPVATAAARALVVQLCLRFAPGQLSLVGNQVERWEVAGLPHARRAARGGFRLGTGVAGTAVAADAAAADAVICIAAGDDEVPPGITTVIDVVEPGAATLRTPDAVLPLAVECLSGQQVSAVASCCPDADDREVGLPLHVSLAELPAAPATADGLPVTLGRDGRGAEVVVDLVHDGPHAIVTGMTGAGKSELLITWVTAIARSYGPERVALLLADFKGGTAFEPLRALPQVASVVTDLDEGQARRGVSSLSAEMRRREGVLAEAGARDVREVSLPRLLIVVDEFAALLQEHPDLAAVFTDIAARGRALGMHLILGTQRAGGVIRDALAANCPLRLSLRVADAADSRAVIGSDAAALLPGGSVGRGRALVRRPEDREPVELRVALTDVADVRGACLRWAEARPAVSPWLPPLPRRLDLRDLVGEGGGGERPRGATLPVTLGLADDPAHQSQPHELLRPGRDRGLVVLGAPGSGRTAVVRSIAAQCHDAVVVPRDAEAALDLLTSWTSGSADVPRLVLCDDIDALHAELPTEYALEFVQRWEQALRAGAATTWVLTAGRATGPLGRVIDLVPRRALLRMASRIEHLAAGGDSGTFARDRLPGRTVLDEREVQFVWVDETAAPAARPSPAHAPVWRPQHALTALVTPGAARVIAGLRDAHPEWNVVAVGTEPGATGVACVLVGDAEAWQRQWALWQGVRAEGEVLVRAERPSDLRQLLGVRELPPYARPHAGRAWSVVGDTPPRRVVVEGLSA